MDRQEKTATPLETDEVVDLVHSIRDRPPASATSPGALAVVSKNRNVAYPRLKATILGSSPIGRAVPPPTTCPILLPSVQLKQPDDLA